MVYVGLDVPAAHNDVLQVDKDERHAAGNAVHHALKSVSSIAQIKSHMQEFIKAKRCENCSFASIFCMYWNMVKAFPEIRTEDGAA